MKQNKFMRLASYLLIATLMTTCTVGGTFAKYLTEKTGYDEARVAKWGIEITAQGDTFTNTYEDHSNSGFDQTVVSDAKVVAPGTDGVLAGIAIEGTPEVAFSVAYEATLTLTGWEIDGEEYCPLIFTIGDEEITMETAGGTIALFTEAVAGALEGYNQNYPAGGTVAADDAPTVEWRWEFEGDNEKDTALGNLETAPTIRLELTTTVTQLD